MLEKKLIIFDFYGTIADSSDRLYDGTKKLLLGLSEKHSLSVNSSMGSERLRQVIDTEGLAACFSDILGFNLLQNKTAKINGLLKKYGASPKDALFVTDTLGDIREGTTAGVACIGVTWGTQDRDTLAKGEPYAIVDTVPELEEAIEKFFVI